MIELIQFYPAWNIPNASPFCMKLETYLKMASIPYQNGYTNDPRKMPNGKLPAIKDNGKLIVDSRLIITHLENTHGQPLDGHLSASEKATAHAFGRMIEEHLYWGMVYSRWILPENFSRLCQDWFSVLPWPLRLFIPKKLQKNVRAQLNGAGLGRLTHEQIITLCQQDIDALADFLGDKTFFMGEQPSSIDACVHAILVGLMNVPIESEIKTHALSKTNLTAYCQRMNQRYWADKA